MEIKIELFLSNMLMNPCRLVGKSGFIYTSNFLREFSKYFRILALENTWYLKLGSEGSLKKSSLRINPGLFIYVGGIEELRAIQSDL